MNILVTGSNGFLGTYFKVFNNLQKEHKLILGSTSKADDTVLFESLYANAEEVLKHVPLDIIIHFAAVIPSSFSEANYEGIFLPNVEMMRHLFNLALKKNIRKFIYISGFGSMLKPELLDIKDFYTMSKITGELFCSVLTANGVQAASLRISAPYGEFSRVRNVINIFVDNTLKNKNLLVYGTGKREQNFTYAGDILKAVELCLQKDIHGIYNIVSKQNTSMYELAKTIIGLTGTTVKIVVGTHEDPQENYAPIYDYERSRKELGYEPEYDIKKGLERYIAWLKKDENRRHI